MFDDAYFMKKALVEANVAFDMDEIPIGAVVVCQNQIIGNLEYWDKRHRYYARKLLQSSRGFQK